MLLTEKFFLEDRTFQDATLNLAYNELCKYLGKRFPCKDAQKSIPLDVEFKTGKLTEGYNVELQDEKLVFNGTSPVEILYAVYDFAEECLGFCFFEPGVDRQNADSAEIELTAGKLFSARPLLKRSGFIQEFPFSDDNYIIGDWMAKNRMNYILTWMKYYDKLSTEMLEFYRVRGIEIESGHHNFDYWIPLDKYCKEHPEFFAVVDGKRVKYEESDNALLLSKQLCTTNPGLRREIVKNMVQYCKQHPNLRTISLIPNDGFGWCECEECSKFYDTSEKGELYSVSEHVYKADRIYHDMMRDIVSQLRQELPDINVTFCAYINYCAPSEGFKLERNMAVHFAPYWRCINHRLDDPECYTNSHYARDLEKWLAAKAGGEVNIYEYYMGVNLYLSLPMIHHEDIFDEMAWYNRKGVDGVLTQFHLPHWTAYGLNYYMMGKAAWNFERDKSVEHCYRDLFGQDAKDAAAFYDKLKALLVSAGKCHIPYPFSLLSRTELEQYEDIFDSARSLAAKAPNDKFRQELAVWAEYMLRYKQLFDDYQAGRLDENGLDEFLGWIHSHRDTRVFVHDKFDMYFKALRECLRTGKQWYHFNIDWEDGYIKKHRQTLNT
jgi:hypothetical protein